jgi:hypothetical protein
MIIKRGKNSKKIVKKKKKKKIDKDILNIFKNIVIRINLREKKN